VGSIQHVQLKALFPEDRFDGTGASGAADCKVDSYLVRSNPQLGHSRFIISAPER
jgi:hypothetical protein